MPHIETPFRSAHQSQPGLALINYSDTWRYEETVATWNGLGAPAFDDSQWSSGQGVLGFSRKAAASARPKNRAQEKSPVHLLFPQRNSSPEAFASLGGERAGERGHRLGSQQISSVVDQIIDDGAVYYLNGKELARVRMPAA